VYSWAYLPLLAGSTLLALTSPPRFNRETRILDVALCLIVLVGAAQLVPLPLRVIGALAPGALSVRRALTLGGLPSSVPLSIDPRSTLEGLAIFAAAVSLYWSARRTFAFGGVRLICRVIGWLGLLMACAAIVQLGVSRGRIFGFWTPRDTGSLPFGPFVNRNHAATWLVMAIPVCFGYLLARLRANGAPRGGRLPLFRHALDARTIWLAGSATVMLLALAMSLSRSGAIAFAAASALAAVFARSRLDSVRRAWAAGAVVVAALAVLQFADVIAVANRFGQSAQGTARRVHIWHDTIAMCRSLWPTGSGIGTFQNAMLLFQTGDRTYYFNDAHNHFLQVAAEGGVLLAVPVLAGVMALAAAARARMAAEVSGLLWIRAGAATGLLAVTVQSLWETGLRTPANAVLAAVLAAIVTHPSRNSGAPPAVRSDPWR
jgi:hypothetical protein